MARPSPLPSALPEPANGSNRCSRIRSGRPGAGIAHLQDEPTAAVGADELEPAAMAAHGLERVARKVEQHPEDLILIGDQLEPRIDLDAPLDGLDALVQGGAHAGDDLGEPERHPPRWVGDASACS